MSLFSDGIISLSLGETLIGTDDTRLVNTRMEGREAVISHEDVVLGGAGLFATPNGRRSVVRVLRNTTGAALLPGELCVIDPAAGAAGSGKATAKAGADEKWWYVVDPLLPAAGVADDDLFIAFVRGLARVKVPAAGLTLTADGAPLVSAASGRATEGAADGSESEIIGGFFLADTTAIAANALVDVVLNLPWE